MTEPSFTEREFTPFGGNAFGLVYEGALTENADGAVNIHAIRYPYRDFTAVANVYTPAGYDPTKSYPAVVVAHPNGGLPTTLDAYGPAPSRQAVADATSKVSSKEFSVDEYCAMVEACCSTAYPTVD